MNHSLLKIDKKLIKQCFRPAVIFLLIALSGCAKSVINIDTKADAAPYPMFAQTPSRNFYQPINAGDSLVLKWEAEINGGFPNSSVTIHDHYAFVSDLSGRIYCFDINTGKTAGQLKQKGAVYTSPLIKNFNLIYAYSLNDENNSELIIYDFKEGKYVTEVEDIKGRALSEMILNNDEIYFVTENGIIYSFDSRGKKIFEHTTNSVNHSSPALFKDVLIFGNDKGELTGFNVKNEKTQFKIKLSDQPLSHVSVFNTLALIGDYSGELFAFDINEGKLKWNYKTGKRINMAPAFDDKNIYAGNLGGSLFALSASGELLWQIDTDGVLNASPLITMNKIFAPDMNEKVHIIDKNEGKILQTISLPGRVKLSPVYFDNLLFIGYENGVLAAYEIAD